MILIFVDPVEIIGLVVVTPQTNLLALITDVDSLLTPVSSGGLGVTALDPQQSVLILQKVREYLVQQLNESRSQGVTEVSTPAQGFSPVSSGVISVEQETARQLSQAVMAYLDIRRHEWFHPLQADLEALRQQKQTLQQEIRQLSEERQQALNTFLAEAQTQLKQNVQQVFRSFPTTGSSPDSLTPLTLSDPIYGYTFSQLEQLRGLQQQTDQLHISLDQNLRGVFETLTRDLQAYQYSFLHHLEQSIEQMQQNVIRSMSHLESPSASEITSDPTVFPYAGIEIQQLSSGELQPSIDPPPSDQLHPSIDPPPSLTPSTDPLPEPTPVYKTLEDSLFEDDGVPEESPSEEITLPSIEPEPLGVIATEMTLPIIEPPPLEEVILESSLPITPPARESLEQPETVEPAPLPPPSKVQLFPINSPPPTPPLSLTSPLTLDKVQEVKVENKNLSIDTVNAIQHLTDLLEESAVQNILDTSLEQYSPEEFTLVSSDENLLPADHQVSIVDIDLTKVLPLQKQEELSQDLQQLEHSTPTTDDDVPTISVEVVSSPWDNN